MGDVARVAVSRRAIIGFAAVMTACTVGWVVGPTLAVAAGSLSAVATAVLVRSAWRHAQVTRALTLGSRPGEASGIPVRWRPFSSHVAVAGLHRPSIFCDPALPERLTEEELHAVLLHERCHQRRRDPLRLVALSALTPVVGRLPGGSGWIERQRSIIEIRADRHALEHGASRSALARALLKLDGHLPAPQPAAAGFVSATELRLRALLEPDAVSLAPTRRRRSTLAIAVVLGLCAAGMEAVKLFLVSGLACGPLGC